MPACPCLFDHRPTLIAITSSPNAPRSGPMRWFRTSIAGLLVAVALVGVATPP